LDSSVFAYLGLIVLPRWYRRATVVVGSAIPTDAQAIFSLESNDEFTTLYASVSLPDPGATSLSQLVILVPPWPIERYSAQAFP